MTVINFAKMSKTNAFSRIADFGPESVGNINSRTHRSITRSPKDAGSFSASDIELLDFAHEILCLHPVKNPAQELKQFFPDNLWDLVVEPTHFGRLVSKASKAGLLPLICEGRASDNHQLYRLDVTQRPFRKPSELIAGYRNLDLKP